MRVVGRLTYRFDAVSAVGQDFEIWPEDSSPPSLARTTVAATNRS